MHSEWTMLPKLNVRVDSVLTEEGETLTNPNSAREIFLLLFLFVTCSFPHGGFAHQHRPSLAHPQSPREGVAVVWEMVRAQHRAVQGKSKVCLWMTTECCRADRHGIGNSFHRWEPEHSIAERRVSELQFNKPSTASAPITRNLINAVRCHGSVHLKQREE